MPILGFSFFHPVELQDYQIFLFEIFWIILKVLPWSCRLFIFFFHFSLSTAACPSGWKIFHDHCYKFASERRTWTDSRAKCKSEGADLVKISSTAENNFVANNKKSSNAWLGLRRGSDHKFYWTDGTRVVFTSWGRGEPNDSGGSEDCGHMWNRRRTKWNDAQCSNRWTYVCEKG